MAYSWTKGSEKSLDQDVAVLSSSRRTYRGYVPWVAAALAVLIWWEITALHLVSAVALPSPVAVFHDLVATATVGYSGQTLLNSTLFSLGRISLGFVLAVLVGIPIGFWMATTEWVFLIIDPFLQFLRPIPPLAYIPLMVAWFGIGELPKVILIFFCTIPIIIISAMSGVKNVQESRRRVAECLGANRWQMFRYVVLPSALPEVFTGMRVGIGVAWTCLVAAEMIAASKGLGWMIQAAGGELQIGVVFVGIIMIGLLGYGMELGIRTLEHKMVPWKGKA